MPRKSDSDYIVIPEEAFRDGGLKEVFPDPVSDIPVRQDITVLGADEGEDTDRPKIPYEARIAPVANGFVISIGCKTFVAGSRDLNGLVEYYKGKGAPKEFGMRDREAYREHYGGDEAQIAYDDCPIQLPSFLDKKDFKTSVKKVDNGWIVIIGEKAYVTKEELDMLGLIAGRRIEAIASVDEQAKKKG